MAKQEMRNLTNDARTKQNFMDMPDMRPPCDDCGESSRKYGERIAMHKTDVALPDQFAEKEGSAREVEEERNDLERSKIAPPEYRDR